MICPQASFLSFIL